MIFYNAKGGKCICLSAIPLELAEYITVELYQTIENQSLNLSKRPYEPELQIGFKRALIQVGLPTANQEYLLKQNKQYFGNRYFVDGFKFLKKYDNYDYVVCDEAHYFLMYSNYNTNTFMSYKFIKMYFSHKTRIFMSATIDEIKCFIERDEEKGNKYRTFWYDYKYAQGLSYNLKNNLFAQQRKFHYVQELDYDYINVKVIYHLKELATLIVKGTAKWLVFVDSKDFGNRLKRKISEISSEYETILQTEKESYYERCRRILIKELEKNTDEEIPSDQFKEFKKKLMPELKALVEHVDVSHESYAKYKRSAGRTDRPISEDFMDFLRENCDIPFKVTSTSGFYYVEKVEVTESTSD